jgi:hypothetical protein
MRPLGIPTVADRIAQMVVMQRLRPKLEPCFHPDSYGYRLGKSALEAVGQARKRCYQYNWVLDLDIKGLFDNIDHKLLIRAVRKHTKCKWMLLYIERWLLAPVQLADGQMLQRDKGVPQGGVISPAKSRPSTCLVALSGGWLNVVWSYILRRRRLSTVRMLTGQAVTQTRSSISWVLPLGLYMSKEGKEDQARNCRGS